MWSFTSACSVCLHCVKHMHEDRFFIFFLLLYTAAFPHTTLTYTSLNLSAYFTAILVWLWRLRRPSCVSMYFRALQVLLQYKHFFWQQNIESALPRFYMIRCQSVIFTIILATKIVLLNPTDYSPKYIPEV
jgi:hypothetical protein